MKVLIIVMKMVQAQLLRKTQEKRVAYLLDDVFAELDEDFQHRLLQGFAGLESQVFLCGVEFPRDCWKACPPAKRKYFG